MTDEYIRWKASQARPWAKSVRDAMMRADSIRASLDAEIERYDGIKGVSYDGDGRGNGMDHGDDAMASIILRLEALRVELVASVDECSSVVAEFRRCCRQLDGRYDAALTYHYECGRTWDEVGRAMDYAPDYVRNVLSVEALAALYEVMPHRYRDPMQLSMD